MKPCGGRKAITSRTWTTTTSTCPTASNAWSGLPRKRRPISSGTPSGTSRRAGWVVHPCEQLYLGSVTTSSVFYRCWFKKIEWDPDAHMLLEPGDWNRFRRFKYFQPLMLRYPEPLLRHYRERSAETA